MSAFTTLHNYLIWEFAEINSHYCTQKWMGSLLALHSTQSMEKYKHRLLQLYCLAYRVSLFQIV